MLEAALGIAVATEFAGVPRTWLCVRTYPYNDPCVAERGFELV